jgi:N utilization substance protein B
MGDRRQARELALQALFFLDIHEGDPLGGLDDFCEAHAQELPSGGEPFFRTLVEGVVAGKDRIDALVNQCSKNWRISRMPAVDRNIMRIAAFEMLEMGDIPCSVSINEAVDIGKKYGTRESGAFINGVLDRIRTQENLA